MEYMSSLDGYTRHGDVLAFSVEGTPLSPWQNLSIRYKENVFVSISQFIGYAKAKHYQDIQAQRDIVSMSDPREIRMRSSRLHGTEADSSWPQVMELALRYGYREAIIQNLCLMPHLALTKGTCLAFAVPHEHHVSTGLGQNDPAMALPDSWPGKNALGNILNDLRDEYFADVVQLLIAKDVAILDAEDQQIVIVATQKYLDRGREIFQCKNIPHVPVHFDLRGKVAGQACFRGKDVLIRYNPVLLAENWDHFLFSTVPHEVAHVVARAVFGADIKPHGTEWKSVMTRLGVPPNRCHKYSTVNASVKRGGRYLSRCACRMWLIDQGHHGKVKCRKCGKGLIDVTTEDKLLELA